MEMMVSTHQNHNRQQQAEPNIETDKLSYEIFSILESKFLFGYDEASSTPTINTTIPAPLLPKSQRGKVCILSIDGGGGMRGILVGKALSYLEQALKSTSGDPKARISDYFDLAAGTGVGGIFTAMLFSSDDERSVYHADDTWRFLAEKGRWLYDRKKRKEPIFCCLLGDCRLREVAAATVGMEKSLKETFGEALTLRNTVKPVLIPCYDLVSSAPLVFSRADALESEAYDFRLWEVCRATSAEPGRFEPVELRSIDRLTRCIGVDGGLVMCNPAAAAITHVLHNKQEFPFVRGVEDLLVLSLGAGSDGGDIHTPQSYRQVRRWRENEWMRPVSQIASDGAADLVDHAVAMAFSHCQSNNNYVRIQASLSSGLAAGMNDDPSPSNVNRLLGLAEEMLKQKNVESVMFGGVKRIGEHTNSEKLDWFARELVLEQQRRSSRIAPTVAFKQLLPPKPC